MPNKQWYLDQAKTHVAIARNYVNNVEAMANSPGAHTVAAVEEARLAAKQAIDRAADAATMLVAHADA